MKQYRNKIGLFIGLCLLSNVILAQSIERIRFVRNTTSAVVNGVLRGYEAEKLYVLRVRDDQTLYVDQIATDTKLVSVTITDPNGKDISDSDASCNNHKKVFPTIAGDYKVRVVECRKTDAWRGKFHIKIEVI